MKNVLSANDLKRRLQIASVMLLNIASAVGIVVMNKKLFDEWGFNFPNVLMTLHFLISWCGIVVYQRLGGFELAKPEKLPSVKTCLSIATYQTMSVMLVNYSLVYNSIGVYQVLKLTSIPILCLMEYWIKGITYSVSIWISLILLLVGVYITTATDASGNMTGLLFGLAATVSSGSFQIKVKELTQGLNSEQGLYYTAPYVTVMFAIVSVVTDNVGSLPSYSFTVSSCGLLLSSGLAALCINLSVYYIVGSTDPVTYQVVGHVKTVLVLAAGFIFFEAVMTSQNTIGMTIAMVGVVWYTRLKLNAKRDVYTAPKEKEEDELAPHKPGI
eukprot:TRINITY_DN8428_c1_g1_i1.p1 TRINITY_DN8428_c1_g1~~TRINITY_DN8428_c1_g1_i1.p1  ORF type:complete len:354 (+),score=43.31 TRINITY_DN8428_c1_g1_i1:80-1063(+)